MATINDVARMAGVSSTTVSHVVNSTRKVNEETAERVHRAIKALNFVPSSLARGLRKKTTRTIGVVSDFATNPFFGEVVGGIEEVCCEQDFGFFMSFTKLRYDFELGMIEDLQRRGIEGLILQACSPDSQLEDTLARLEIPAVFFQRCAPGWRADSICTDDADGARQVMDHLASLGHERIALISGYVWPSHPAGRRESVYRRCLSDLGIGVDETLVGNGYYSYEGGYQAATEMLRLAKRPTAFFCIADQIALGCVAAVRDAGLTVPDDISVVGYDNLQFLQYLHPALTSVDHQAAEQGRLMARQLLARIENPALPFRTIPVQPRLVVRSSTAPRRR